MLVTAPDVYEITQLPVTIFKGCPVTKMPFTLCKQTQAMGKHPYQQVFCGLLDQSIMVTIQQMGLEKPMKKNLRACLFPYEAAKKIILL